MSLCYSFRRRWNAFKHIVYGYEDEAYNNNLSKEKNFTQKAAANKQEGHACFEKDNLKEVYDKHTMYSENWCNYRIPKRQIYEAYGIEFESREDRDAFESKMERMEKILEKELHYIREQHMCLKQEYQGAVSRSKSKKGGKRSQKQARKVTRSDNPLVEELSVINEIQDVLDQMTILRNELQEIEKILSIEVRERTLHTEPRLIHLKAPEDELSEQMQNDGRLRYCSSDKTEQRISCDILPPPLSLSELLAKQDT